MAEPWRARRATPPNEEPSDRELVSRAQDGDRAAFASLYRRYVDAVHRYCFRRLEERDAAEDATSLVFTRALASLPRYREGSFRAWLFAIAHNAVVDAHRRRRPNVPLDDLADRPAADPTPEESVLIGEERRSVRTLLAHLTPDQRRVIELRLAGLNGAEIARVLGRSTNAVDVAQYRAMRRLRDLLVEPEAAGEVRRARR
jgi:RNA polymerase sigma-70 factor (ECF subfamily)